MRMFTNRAGLRAALAVVVLAPILFALLASGHAAGQAVTLTPGISTLTGNGLSGPSSTGDSPSPVTALGASINFPEGIVTDSAQNVYFADTQNHVVRKIDRGTGIMTIFAGTPGTPGFSGDGSAATSARLNSPDGLAFDAAGDLYIADTYNYVIRRVDATTQDITTIAGLHGQTGNTNGAISIAQFGTPTGLAFDTAGNLYIVDGASNEIRKLQAGVVSTVAGTGTPGFAGDSGLATAAQLKSPTGITFDPAGNLYIADEQNHVIRKVAAGSGDISTIAGQGGTHGSTGDGGLATAAYLYFPYDVKFDGGNLYIADRGNARVRVIYAANGDIATAAGTGTAGHTGDGGAATSAELTAPFGLAVDGVGNLYVTDIVSSTIREIPLRPNFPNTNVAASAAAQTVLLKLNQTASLSSISVPVSQGGVQEYHLGTVTGCVVDGSTVNASGTLCTVPVTFSPGYPGLRAIPLIAVTSAGTFRFGMTGTGLGPQISFTPALITTAVGHTPGPAGSSGDGGPAAAAKLYFPFGTVSDFAGNLYISDSYNYVIRRVDALTGNISTFAGVIGAPGLTGDGGPATAAKLDDHAGGGLAVDSQGNLYISDENNHAVRRVDAVTGIITTVAGIIGTHGQAGDGGPATSAELYAPNDVAFDAAGNMYIADEQNNAIRRLDAISGILTTVAGTLGTSTGYGGDGGQATAAQLHYPVGVRLDAAGNLYIDDDGNNVIRKVTVSTGVITTVAGIQGGGGFSGDGGAAVSALLNDPEGLSLDAAGNLYIADSSNNVMREVNASTGFIVSVAGAGNPSASGYFGDGGPATAALLSYPGYPSLDSRGNLYISDNNNNVVRMVSGVAPLSFASTYVMASSAAQDVTVTNNGNAALAFSALTLPADFNLSGADTTCLASMSLTPGESCVLGVVFAPASVGAKSETLSLVNNQGTQTIPLSGSALINAQTITFPAPASQPLGTPLTLAATSTSGLTVSFASSTTGVCTVSGSTATFVVPGTCTLTASQAGNAGYSPATPVTESFVVTQPMSYLAPASPVGTTTATQTAYLTFSASGLLNAIHVLTLGAPNLDYRLVAGGTCTVGTTYVSGASCTVAYSFTPAYPGQRRGAITLTDGSGALLGTSYLAGVGNGAHAVFSSNQQPTIVSNGFITPHGAAVDAVGNLFVPDTGNSQVFEVPAGTSTAVPLAVANGNFSIPAGTAVDGAGNVFVADSGNDFIKEIVAAGGYVTVLALPVPNMTFNSPRGVAVDGAGNVFVADGFNNAVKEVLAAGGYTSVLTLAAGTANLNQPQALAVDGAGNVFVTDTNNNLIKEILAPDYTTVQTLGSGFSFSQGIAVDAIGNVFVSDAGNGNIKEILVAGGYVTVNTLAGGFPNAGVAVDAAGNVYFAQLAANAIEKLDYADAPSLSFATTAAGLTSGDSPQTVTVANIGNTALVFSALAPSSSDFSLGGSVCSTANPVGSGLSCDLDLSFTPQSAAALAGAATLTDNSLLVASTQTIALAGTGTIGSQIITFVAPPSQFVGTPLTLSATVASGLAISYSSSTPSVCTVAGNVATFLTTGSCTVTADQPGNANYTAAASVSQTFAVIPVIAVGSTSAVQTVTLTSLSTDNLTAIHVLTWGDPNLDFILTPGGTCTLGASYNAGDTCTVTYTFTPTHPGQRLGGVTLEGSGSSLMGSSYISGVGTGPQMIFSSNHLETTLATGFGYPEGIAVDATGNVFVADGTAVKEVLATGGYTTVNTIGTVANVSGGVAVDGNGNVFVANGNTLAELVAQGGYSTVTSIPGQFGQLNGVAVDGVGNVFIADSNFNLIQNLGVPGTNSTYQTLGAGFFEPESLALDGSGNVFVADTGNNAIKEITAASNYTTVVTLAAAYTQAGGFAAPEAVALDAAGNVYVADATNNAIKEIVANGGYTEVLTLASDFSAPYGVAVDGSGNVFVADSNNAALKKLDFVTPPSLSFLTTAVETTSSDSPLILTLANNGNLNLAFTSLLTGTTNFSLTGSACVTTAPLVAGASCDLDVSFTPQAIGAPLNDSATITDNTLNIAGTAQVMPLSGTATIGAQTITFANPGAQPVGVPLTLAAAASSGLAVSFASSTTGVCTVSAGVATFLVPGSCTLIATQAGNANYAAAASVSQTFAVAVTVAPTISFSVTGKIYGAAPFPIAATSDSSGAITYSVVSGPATVSGSTVTLTGTGAVVLLATQAAAGAYTSGTQTTTFLVSAAAAVVTATVTPASPAYGQAATVTVNETAGALPVAGSTATLTVNGQTYSCVTNSSGSCMVTVTAGVLSGGANSIAVVTTATAAVGAGSATAAVAVTPVVPVVTATVSPASPAYGQAATVTVNETAGALPIAGSTATVTVDGQAYTCVTNSSGSCPVTVPAGVLIGGANPITVITTATVDATAGNATASVAVTLGTPVVTATVSPASPVYGQPATVTVNETAGGLPVAGSTATVTVAGHPYSCVTNSSGSCPVTVPAGVLIGGANPITVITTATVDATAGNATASVTVTPAAAVVTATVSPANPAYGQSATVTVNETAGGLPAAGSTATVTIDGQTYSCVTSATGSCTVTVPAGVLIGGANPLAVATSATANVTAGSVATSVTVTLQTPVVTAAIAPASLIYGQAATVTVTETASASPVSGATATVTISGQVYTCVTNAAGICSVSLPGGALSGGSDTLTVATAAAGSVSPGAFHFAVTVGPAPTTLTLGSSSTEIIVGAPVTLTATVASATPGTPTGTVSFYANGTAIGTGPVTGGVASLTLSTLAVGADSISGIYGGDANFLGSNAAGFTQTVLVNFTLSPGSGFGSTTPTQAIQPGGTAVFPLSLGIINGFVGPVTMSATGLPPGATVSFNPDIIQLDGIHPGTTIMSVVTAPAHTRALPPPLFGPGSRIVYGWLLLPLLAIGGRRGRWPKRSRSALLGTLGLLSLGAATAGLFGCGSGGYFGAAPTSYVITVTATSGPLHHSTTVTLTIQ